MNWKRTARRHRKGIGREIGADLAFDMGEMVAHPDVDPIAVAVCVPWYQDLVMAAINANKPVCCEWPLGTHLPEATEMAEAAVAAGVPSLVGQEAERPAVYPRSRRWR